MKPQLRIYIFIMLAAHSCFVLPSFGQDSTGFQVFGGINTMKYNLETTNNLYYYKFAPQPIFGIGYRFTYFYDKFYPKILLFLQGKGISEYEYSASRGMITYSDSRGQIVLQPELHYSINSAFSVFTAPLIGMDIYDLFGEYSEGLIFDFCIAVGVNGKVHVNNNQAIVFSLGYIPPVTSVSELYINNDNARWYGFQFLLGYEF